MAQIKDLPSSPSVALSAADKLAMDRQSDDKTKKVNIVNLSQLLTKRIIVQSMTLLAPPTHVLGNFYVLGTGTLTGDWSAKTSGDIVISSSSNWVDIPAVEGLIIYDLATKLEYRHDGSGWVVRDKMTPIIFRAAMGDQPTANPATWGTLEATGTPNKLHWLLFSMDDSTDEFMYFPWVIPPNYKGGDLTVTIFWSNSGTVANDAILGGAFWVLAEGDDMGASSFAAAQYTTKADTTTADAVRVTTIPFTAVQADTPVAGMPAVLEISRDANHANDNLVGNVNGFLVMITED